MPAAPCCDDPIGLLFSSLSAVRRTVVLPAPAQGTKSAALGLRLGALLVCTGRWSGGMNPASTRDDSAALMGRPTAGVGLRRPAGDGGLGKIPAQALGAKVVASGLRLPGRRQEPPAW